MDRVILQVPMSKTLRKQAETVAYDFGFSSLQEIIRVILTKLAKRELSLKITEAEVIKLSPAAKRRYEKMTQDFKAGRNIYRAKNVEDLMRYLNS